MLPQRCSVLSDETRNAADIIGIIGCVGTEENPQIERIKLKREREWDMNKEWSELNKTMQAQIKKKNTCEMGIDTLLGLRRELIPLKLLQIDASVGLQIHAFPKKQKCLFGPVRREPPRVVDDAMTGKMAIIFSARQDFCNQSGVFFFADKPRDLSVGGDTAFRNFRDDGKHFVGEIVGERGHGRAS